MNKLKEYFETLMALIVMGVLGLMGLIAILLCMPGFWLAVIAYILVTNL
jgi:hypothetical protein